MPVVDDPGRPRGRHLVAADGRVLASFVDLRVNGRRRADLLALADGVGLEAAVAAILADLPGWDVAGEEALGRALVAHGGRIVRHAHLHGRDLRRDPAPSAWLDAPGPPGVAFGPIDRSAAELAAAWRAAFAPGHPDYHGQSREQTEAELQGIFNGSIMGPLLPCSVQAVDHLGVCGAALVNASEGAAPEGGPWLTELFRHPRSRGTGTALLRRSLAVATRDGLPSYGLAVTDGNPASRLYEAHGLARLRTSVTVRM